MLKRETKRAFAILLCLYMIIGETNITVLAESKSTKEEDTQTVSVSSNDMAQVNESCDGVTTESGFEGNGFHVTFEVQDYWNGGFNANVKIENTGDVAIENWVIGFDYQGEIASVWNAVLDSSEPGKYVVKNAGWNQDIAVGQSVEFGISGQGDFMGFPSAYQMLGRISNLNTKDYSIEYKVTSDWGSGFIANITIVNNTDKVLEDWVLEFDFGRNIDQIWNALIESRDNKHYVIKNANYNSKINPGQNVTFGFSGNMSSADVKPENCSLYRFGDNVDDFGDIVIILDGNDISFYESESGDYYQVDKEIKSLFGKAKNIQNVDTFSYSISDLSGEIMSGTLDKSEKWEIKNFGLGFGYNSLVFVVKSGNEEKKFEFIIVNTCLANMNNAGIDYTTDSDGDGVSNYLEAKYKLDSDSIDTDGDGLNDCMELLVPNISPTSLDGDKDGVLDADEDYDGDGLSNYYEIYVAHTDYSSIDSDNDTLSDYDEVKIFNTDPNNKDTDGDGVSDDEEIKIGSDPLVVNDTFRKTVELVSDDKHSTSVKVTVNELTAEQVPSLNIGRCTDIALTDKNIPGYIDDGYNFIVDGEISGAIVEVMYDTSLEEDDFEPALYYYNTDVQLLELVENQSWSSGKIIAHLEHFSKYILVNKKIYEKAWSYTFYETEDDRKIFGLDIAFVIDDSGSMSWNDPNDIRAAVTNKFIDKLTDNDRAAIISFTSSASTLSSFTSNKDSLKSSTSRLRSSGETSLSVGISRALSLFTALSPDETRLKYIVMLTDGDGSYSTAYTSQALSKDIIIYTIGLGSSVSSSVLCSMAETTGGQYYHADKAEQLNYIFDSIAQTSDYFKDTDKDGICDYYEKEMAAGRLVLGNGVPVTSVSYLNPDSDGDGIIDGKEILITKFMSYTYVIMSSNPGIVDTDKDGINDKEDEYPLTPTVPQTLLVHQTKNREGLKKNTTFEENIVADDLTFNDRSYTQIVSDCKLVGTVAGVTPEFMMWDELANLFLLGLGDFDWDLEMTLIDLLNEFRYSSSNTGVSVRRDSSYNLSLYHYYSDSVLTDRVKSDVKMKEYVDNIENIIVNELKAYNGDLRALAATGPSAGVVSDEINATLRYPVLELGESIALTLAIHDFQGHNITVEDFVFDGTNFSGVIKFHFYDHFGLDYDDYQYAPGFCDWYTLQHYDKFDGKYCPFITIVDMSCKFSGSV